jgi:muramoyltetrapeptide carboxypeptidase LdcA involved in peptidoglycan recycling
VNLRYPRPLAAGDRIGVTSPSSGVGPDSRERLGAALAFLGDRGYDVEVGDCMDGSTHVSASARERADELMRMLLDPVVRAVVPPWGGETGIDVLPLLDFAALAEAEPTWFVGYSDTSTLLTPVTLLAGWATVHGSNLMDTADDVPAGLLPWLDVATAPTGSTFRQGGGNWKRLDGGTQPVDVTGRLIGGCIETLSPVSGTRYGDTSALRRDYGGDLIVYVEAAEERAFAICRYLHGMRLAGFFDGAAAILVGRTGAPDEPTLTQADAVRDALGMLGVPLIADVEFGHVPPQLTIVNGALGHVQFTADERYLEQTLA